MSPPTALETLEQELAEQPLLVEQLLRDPPPALSALVSGLCANPPRFVGFVARGSSAHAALFGRVLLESRMRVPVSMLRPSAWSLYHSGPRLDGALVIAVSQSGRGEDLTSVLSTARAEGARTVAIVNHPDSLLAAAADTVLECRAHPERSIPATKSVMAQLMLLWLLCEGWTSGGSSAVGIELTGALQAALTADAAALAARLAHVEHVFVLGRGVAEPVALELALKLKEMARVHASAWSSAEFLHGPITLLGPTNRVLVLDAGGASSEDAVQTARTIAQRGGEAYLVRAGRWRGFRDAKALAIQADLDEGVAAILLLALGQRLALKLGLARGVDPSSPPLLRKVISTR